MSRTARLSRAVLLTLVLAALAIPVGINTVPAFVVPPDAQAEQSPPAAQRPPQKLSPLGVISNLSKDAPLPTTSQLAVLLDASLGAPIGSMTGQVVDGISGQTLYDRQSERPVIPGSNLKLLTALSVLKNIDSTKRFSTRVLAGAEPNQIVLQAGGDVLLGSGASTPEEINGHAGLQTLAQLTAKALGKVSTPVSVIIDDSLFSGPALSPEWQPEDVAAGEIAPIYPIALNSAQPESKASAGRPQDAALAAGQAFVAALAKQGVAVSSEVDRPQAGQSTNKGAELAKVESATIAEQVNYMLANSDNYLAEVLARLAAVQQGKAGDFTEATALTTATIGALGIATDGLVLADSSGLAIRDRVSAAQLTQAVRAMTSSDNPVLHAALGGLPIGGLTGTLSQRFNDPATADGAGLVRAKTGTLNTVLTLSGYVVDRDGRLLVFSFMANDLSNGPASVRPILDKSAAILAGCGCR
ncbi:D-alanyl-D-alanine carboxypeptidase/D-alanyl-D-alanine endopeptidase [Psychromicrobium lacuslunae]|nr:D-alanyl-D-alanine carboxypeptidase/D-alanyl-D-alanine-endopeptidase [Psychromicrobium lacuslunae]